MYQAEVKTENIGWTRNILDCILENNLNIVSLSCPEVTFGGYAHGSARGKHGIDYYQGNAEFVQHCRNLAKNDANRIVDMQRAGYSVLMVIGIENSPTCAVNYMYTHSGMQHRRGIFLDFLHQFLQEENIHLQYVGINRGHCKKAIQQINSICIENGDII